MASFSTTGPANWNATTNWTQDGGAPSRTPQSGDTVNIAHAVTGSQDVTWGSGTINLNTGSSLTFTAGTFTLNGGSINGNAIAWAPVAFYDFAINGGGFSAMSGSGASITVTHSFSASGSATIQTTGSVTVPFLPAGTGSGTLSFSTPYMGGALIVNGPATANAGYAFNFPVTFNGDVTFTGCTSGNVTIPAGVRAVLPAGSTFAPGGPVNLNGIFDIYGTFNPGNASGVSGTGVCNCYSSDSTLTGLLNCLIRLHKMPKFKFTNITAGASSKIIVERLEHVLYSQTMPFMFFNQAYGKFGPRIIGGGL